MVLEVEWGYDEDEVALGATATSCSCTTTTITPTVGMMAVVVLMLVAGKSCASIGNGSFIIIVSSLILTWKDVDLNRSCYGWRFTFIKLMSEFRGLLRQTGMTTCCRPGA